mmetsp:Transcript_29213/g.85647  ORF Transcript_29213/g.85647 Transcript_29213/m.85647 type:complete len:207 (+) Transcript_29213:621-1241(+)
MDERGEEERVKWRGGDAVGHCAGGAGLGGLGGPSLRRGGGGRGAELHCPRGLRSAAQRRWRRCRVARGYAHAVRLRLRRLPGLVPRSGGPRHVHQHAGNEGRGRAGGPGLPAAAMPQRGAVGDGLGRRHGRRRRRSAPATAALSLGRRLRWRTGHVRLPHRLRCTPRPTRAVRVPGNAHTWRGGAASSPPRHGALVSARFDDSAAL